MVSNSTQTPHRRATGEGPEENVASERRRRESVGALLRQTRIGYGADLPSTAAALRIRAAYITAIEQGDYAALPGEVYALGFIRAYAVHLGLDGDEAVRRFKNEAGDFERPRGLSFPMPLAKRSVPGGTMVLAALVLAICGYGLWYYLSTGEHGRPDQVSVVPSQFLPPTTANAAPAAALPAPSAPAAPDAAATADMTTAVQAAAAAPTIDAITPSPTAPASASPLPALSDTTADAAAPAPPHPMVTALALPPPAAVAPAPAPVAVVPAPGPAPAAPASQIATAPANAMPVPAGPHIFGAVTGPFRITIRAASDAWLQVRDRGDAVVAQRLLHQGDLYRVPDQPGLVLRTGNASGLEITVDGRPAKPIAGTVRDNILLDPARLVAGTAAVE